jgi:hypothetical protein
MPILKVCPGRGDGRVCGQLIPTNKPRCANCEAQHRDRQRQRLAAQPNRSFYASSEWKRTRRLALQQADRRCQACGISGLLDVHRSCHVKAQHEARREPGRGYPAPLPGPALTGS